MKKVLILSVLLLPITLLAQDAAVPAPEWLAWLVTWLLAVPAVGPYLLVAFQVMGALAVLMTALSASAQALGVLLEKSFKVVGAEEKAAQIKVLADKLVYWLKMLSMFNAKK